MQRNTGKQYKGKDWRSLQEIRDTKGIFHEKMDTIKDRKGKDLRKAEEIKKRGQAIQKCLNDPDNHNVVVTHEEPDSMECEVKWALGSIIMNKVSAGDGIPAELFKILKDDTIKVLHSIRQQIWKTQPWPEKVSFHSNAKGCSNYHTVVLISHASTVRPKFFKLGFNST